MLKTMTIAELKSEIAARESKLAKLQARRKEIAKQLAGVEREIVAISGKATAPARKPRKKASRKITATKITATKIAAKKGKRAKSQPSLADVLANVLAGKGEIKVAEAAKLAVGAGYKSGSAQFGNIVSQTLSGDKRFKKISRGVYVLKGGKAVVEKAAKKVAKKAAKRVVGTPTKPKKAEGKPLIGYVQDVLAKAKDGMRVKEVMAAVQQAGYKSAAKDFYGIVATAIREGGFEKVSRGIYRLKGMEKPAAK